MNVLAIQPDIVWENKPANFSKIRALVSASAPSAGSLVVLPELFATGFSMNLEITRQKSEREDEAFLSGLAREFGVYVAGGVVSPGENRMGRNQAVIFSPGGEPLARYTKIHPFSFGGENEGHEAGAEIVTFDWAGFKVAPFVCYDLRFPEIFRSAAKRGANLFVVMALWPARRHQHWLTLLQARAIENQAYVIGVNRTGREPELSYTGRSVVVDPFGIIIADAGERERALAASVELEIVESWRRDFPALRDAHWRE
jgi:predicted amidohydrolase